MYCKKTILLVAFSCAALLSVPVFAADVAGKVTKCEGNKLTLTLTEAPTWIKKGAAVKIKGVSGTVTDVSGSTVNIRSTKSADCKAGDEINIQKGVKESQGC